ncbi:hypothetical protein SARC_10019 [Sphaeroforma arctica JP610]|uniref:Uncharacterized protein n=1 Tax=Sphaeroforma arctica JP610 TaxID=667725 RepID=A0A0L0FL51_9EUKA|nr:hypothetical protein SARC_10019 [Sphaeroforma arctica JP610]KNC77517.1 hypothetical protein SARC_10019 [Sphaeroforma arctica JP610]|eukprot:XP_014151419.1 hypothetical protein SARC_10019 [Sphaeroforma arctica JP610]
MNLRKGQSCIITYLVVKVTHLVVKSAFKMSSLLSRCAFITAAAYFATIANAAPTSSNFTIGLKTLILTSDDVASFLPEQILESYGASYDILNVVQNFTPITENQLELTDITSGQPKYNSIVYTSVTLGYNDKDGVWQGYGLDASNRDRLDAYCAEYGVRRVFLTAYPLDIQDPAIGVVDGATGIESDDISTMRFVENDMTSELHNALNLDAAFKIGQEIGFGTNKYWLTPARVEASLNQDNHITPIMDLTYMTGKDLTRNIGALVVAKLGTKAEDMYFFITQDVFGLHGMTFGHMWFPWVTRGLFVGERKVKLGTQFDEVFMDGIMYNTVENRKGLFNETTSPYTYRITADDLEAHSAAQERMNQELPEGSNITLEMSFNGIGYGEFADMEAYDPNMNTAAVELFDEFSWVSHEWAKLNMDCFNGICDAPMGGTQIDYNLLSCSDFNSSCSFAGDEPIYPTSGYTPYEYNRYEVSRNLYFADETLKANSEENAGSWSPTSLVSFNSTGYSYTEAVKAMLEKGVRYGAIVNLETKNPYHLEEIEVVTGAEGKILDTEQKNAFVAEMEMQHNASAIKVVRRQATRVYSDCSTPTQLTMEFNSLYGPNCVLCNNGSFRYERDLTSDEIMSLDGFDAAKLLFAFRGDVYQFNQMNMRMYSKESTDSSLALDWIDAATHWVREYTSFPVYAYKFDDLVADYLQREERDNCNITAGIEYIDGVATAVKVSSPNACEAKLTYTTTSGQTGLKPKIDATNTYGTTDSIYTAKINMDTVSIPLEG